VPGPPTSDLHGQASSQRPFHGDGLWGRSVPDDMPPPRSKGQQDLDPVSASWYGLCISKFLAVFSPALKFRYHHLCGTGLRNVSSGSPFFYVLRGGGFFVHGTSPVCADFFCSDPRARSRLRGTQKFVRYLFFSWDFDAFFKVPCQSCSVFSLFVVFAPMPPPACRPPPPPTRRSVP